MFNTHGHITFTHGKSEWLPHVIKSSVSTAFSESHIIVAKTDKRQSILLVSAVSIDMHHETLECRSSKTQLGCWLPLVV